MLMPFLAALVLVPVQADDGYMRWANYGAGSHKVDDQAAGGNGTSDNFPTPVIYGKKPSLRLTLTISRDGQGILKLTNHTSEEAIFRAEDGNLPIVQEAKDANGVWRMVEFRPPAECGNSHHRVFLPALHEWTFVVNLEKEGLKTKIRARLVRDGLPMFSNEIDGLVGAHRFTLSPAWAERYEIQRTDGIDRVVMKMRGAYSHN